MMDITDIKKLCEGVLDTIPVFWDNPNGANEFECPFCTAVGTGVALGMGELKHAKDCAYILAQKISLELE